MERVVFVSGHRLLNVDHTTTYRYAQPVVLGEHRMMFRPREGHDLRLRRSELVVTPTPVAVRWVHDVFDNSVAVATFDATPVLELSFRSTLLLEHHESPPTLYALDPQAQHYPFKYADNDLPDLASALLRHYPDAVVQGWATRFLSGGGSSLTMALLESMSLGIRNQCVYTRRDTKGVQSPSQTLHLRSGSCRDFALLMMEGVRALGLAARFVSGYILIPHEDRTRLVGGGATHAWMQVYLPGAGWVDFDPTNSIIGNRNLIRVAVAWDPRQALPLSGSFVGPASAFVAMDVTVAVTDEGAA